MSTVELIQWIIKPRTPHHRRERFSRTLEKHENIISNLYQVHVFKTLITSSSEDGGEKTAMNVLESAGRCRILRKKTRRRVVTTIMANIRVVDTCIVYYQAVHVARIRIGAKDCFTCPFSTISQNSYASILYFDIHFLID